jgi:proton glutamate symport protein
MKLQTKIFLGLISGIAIGAASRIGGADALRNVLVALEPLGTVFIRLITMVVIPLVVASLFLGIASLGDVRRLGRIGGKTLAYFFVTTMLAAAIGFLVARAAHIGEGLDAGTRDTVAADRAATRDLPVATPQAPDLVRTLVEMTPQNPFAAAAQGDLLPLIIAVCIFGAAATVIRGDGKHALLNFLEGVNELCIVVVRWLMLVAPVAVFVLIAATVAKSGLDLLASLLTYTLVVAGAMAMHVLIVLLPALRFGARLGVAGFLRAVGDAVILAFATASSNVVLPVSISAATNRLGISSEIASFVLPSGVTLNKNGAAVYKAATAVFLANVYGLTIGPAQVVTILLTTVMASAAGAGVPGSSLVTTLIVLNAVGLGPHAAAGIALVMAVDRPIDMCRTTVNTIGNLVGAAWIARSEGEAIGTAVAR